jgi:predicted MFS family arabinose efflux permease
LLENFWWGSVFLINIPVVLGALVLGYFLVPASRDPESTPLDIKGAVASMVAISALVFGIIEGPSHGWASGRVLIAFGSTLVFGLLFVLIERRTNHPMLNLDYFRNRRFSGGATAISIAFFSLFGVIFLLTQYLQFVQGYSALEAGLRTAPVALGMVLGASTAPRLAERFGTTRVVTFGLLVLAAVLGLFTTFEIDTDYWIIGTAIVALSYGMGNVMAPSTDAVMGAVPVAKAGVASATNDVTRQVAGAIGVAVVGSAFNSAYTANMETAVALLPPDLAAAASNSIGAASRLAAQLPGEAAGNLLGAAQQAFINAMGVAIFFPIAIALIGAVLVALFMPAEHLAESAPEERAVKSSLISGRPAAARGKA